MWAPLWTTAARLAAVPGVPVLPRRAIRALVAEYGPVGRLRRRWLAWRAAGLASLMVLADRQVPAAGTVLDLGCGPGLLSRWMGRRSGRTVIGIDASPLRIALAQSGSVPQNVQFRCGDLRAWDPIPGALVGILCVDVLLYLQRAEIVRLLQRLRDRAAAEAVLLIKDSVDRPRWKTRWMGLEERIKSRLAFYGAPVVPRRLFSPEIWAEVIQSSGWALWWSAEMGRWTPYPGWVGVAGTSQNGRISEPIALEWHGLRSARPT